MQNLTQKLATIITKTIAPFIAKAAILALAIKSAGSFIVLIDTMQKTIAGAVIVAMLLLVAYNNNHTTDDTHNTKK